jgi:hypothetical protein
LFIGTSFSNLYTLVHAPAIGRVVVCLVFVIACKYALGHSEVSQPLNLLLIMPPLTLWLSHFASCLPSLQQTPLQLAQAPPPLHLRPPHRVGPQRCIHCLRPCRWTRPGQSRRLCRLAMSQLNTQLVGILYYSVGRYTIILSW